MRLLTNLSFIIGAFFLLCGAILVLASLFGGGSDLVEGFRINLDSGLLMGGFGIVMLCLAVGQERRDA